MAQEKHKGVKHLLGGVGHVGLLRKQLHARVVRVALEHPAGEHLKGVEAEQAADHVEEQAGAREGPALGAAWVQADLAEVSAHGGKAGVREGYLALVLAQHAPGTKGQQGQPRQEVPHGVGPLRVALDQVPVDELVPEELGPEGLAVHIAQAQHEHLAHEAAQVLGAGGVALAHSEHDGYEGARVHSRLTHSARKGLYARARGERGDRHTGVYSYYTQPALIPMPAGIQRGC